MIGYWQDVLKTRWGVDAKLTALSGEYDLNFKALTGDPQGFILKVMRPDCPSDLIDMQIAALEHLKRTDEQLPIPAIIHDSDGQTSCVVPDETGAPRLCWVMELLEGQEYAGFSPKSPDLISNLGSRVGALGKAFEGFEHPALNRDFKWNLTQAGWITGELSVIEDAARQVLLSEISEQFSQIADQLSALPDQAIHNDINDYNILVQAGLTSPPAVSGLIDLGDMCRAPRICDLSIAAAYVVLDHDQPEAALAALVAGYHAESPLTAEELDLLWPLLRMRLAVSVVNSTLMAQENPDDPYVVISQAPAWRFLEGNDIHPGLLRARLRAACGLPVTDAAPRVMAYLSQNRGSFAPLFATDLSDAPMGTLSVEGSTCPRNPFDLPLDEAAKIDAGFDAEQLWLGYYAEPRLIYTAPAFRKGPWKASDRRTVHLAVDGFAPAGTALHAPLAGTVLSVEDRAQHLDYGGVVILRHETPAGDAFYTLYGHLDPEVCTRLKPDDSVEAGEPFCRLGDASQNGGWAPHVHFQLALTTEGLDTDWPGVADPDEMYLWGAICPNPAALLNLSDAKVAFQPIDKDETLSDRRAKFGKNLKLSYANPVMLLRGWRHHLFDEMGRPYLDAYNNVPHVGHAHPRIQAVAADQLLRMNSNTRYLHPAQTAFADKITSKLPAPLTVCFFVNSGSEANELALRLARAASGGHAIVTPDHGYHGNTTGAMDMSAYKFNAKGGAGKPDWVELVEVADDYRGNFDRQDADRAEKFSAHIDGALAALEARGQTLAGFIAETFPSVGGQIIPPSGYLAKVYDRIRAAGGICIADEVQTGLGRLGDYYFGFEHQGAVPDIVVLGKPIGNGHPLGVVVTTPEIAAAFAEGPEFFSTFGGSTLSCRIGKEVLDIVDDENLMDNARDMGARLITGLRTLQDKHAAIGDVRGMGLFLGVDLVWDRGTKAPATELADYVKNRLRTRRILVGTEGPYDNILKIRPPLTIEADDIDMLLAVLDEILSETPVTQALNQHRS